MKYFKSHWKEYRSVWISILLLFIVTRLVLFGISFITLKNIDMRSTQDWKVEQVIPTHPIAATWAVWDSEWYLKIAQNGYGKIQNFDASQYSTVGFFPLYPWLMGIVGIAMAGNYLLAGLLISNIFFIVSAFFLYLLVREDYDEETAKRSIWYLFLFPSAYIFSSVYPESLLLFLWLACMLSAKKDKWFLVGLAGFLAAMAKPIGFIIFIPAIIIYLQKKKFSWKNIRPDIVWLELIPLGLLAVSYLDYIATGDMFAYSHVQQGAWGHHLSNPLSTIYQHITRFSFDWAFNAWILLFFIVLLFCGYKKLSFAYWFFTFLVLLFIPSNGLIIGCLRYFASFFPIVILLSVWGKSENTNRAIVSSMALLQACLFIFWILGFWFVS